MESTKIHEYIQYVTSFLEKHYFNDLVSIILFGSMIQYDKINNVSTDADLIIIVKDSSSNDVVKKIKQEIHAIEKKYSFSFRNNEFSFFKGLQTATGMFVNFFLCRSSDFLNQDFNKVFNINFIMGLLAPKSSVWWSISNQYRCIWGSDLVKLWNTKKSILRSDIIRSFAMNWLLATGALFTFPIYKEIAKFSMEAVKWSLFTWRNYHQIMLYNINKISIIFLQRSGIRASKALSAFLDYRKNNEMNNFFPLLAWLLIIKIHISLLYGKQIKA